MGTGRSHGRRWAAVGGSVVVVVGLVAVTIVVTHRSGNKQPAAQSSSITASSVDVTSPTTTSPSTSPPPSSPPPRTPSLAPAATTQATLRRLAAQRPAGGVSVAALNTTTGAHFSFGAQSGMRTGSVAKLFLLDSVLMQHDEDGSQLSDDELELAQPMIENSDNTAEYSLYLDAGGRQPLVDAAAQLGMKNTVPGENDPALTTTSADDALQMLAPLLSRPITVDGVRHTPLSSYSRSLALNLMRNVESDQRWGVSAVADPGTPVALKNGWLSVDNDNGEGDNDNGLWLVNSVGIVTVHGQPVLLAAFTQHGQDYASGIQLVESLVKAITPAVVAE